MSDELDDYELKNPLFYTIGGDFYAAWPNPRKHPFRDTKKADFSDLFPEITDAALRDTGATRETIEKRLPDLAWARIMTAEDDMKTLAAHFKAAGNAAAADSLRAAADALSNAADECRPPPKTPEN